MEVTYTTKLIWMRRNEVLHQNKFSHPSSIVLKAREEMMHLFRLAQPLNKQVTARSFCERGKVCQRPRTGTYKINWDAACCKGKTKIGVGVIARNWLGQVMETLRAFKQISVEPFEAEAYPLVMAVYDYSQDMGFQNCLFFRVIASRL